MVKTEELHIGKERTFGFETACRNAREKDQIWSTKKIAPNLIAAIERQSKRRDAISLFCAIAAIAAIARYSAAKRI